MSRAAQAVQKAIEEMRRHRPPQNRRPRVAEHPTDVQETSHTDSSPTDVTDELASPQASEASTTEGGDVAKSRRATTSRSRKSKTARGRSAKAKTAKRTPRAAKAAPSRSNGQWSGDGVPDPAGLRLARGGVTAGDGSTLHLNFANGYHVAMKVSGDDPVATRDHLITWLRRRLGADRA